MNGDEKEMMVKLVRAATKLVPDCFLWRLRPYYKVLLPNITNITFLPTFQCNYSCPYCLIKTRTHYDDKYPREVEHSWEEWIGAFNKFPASVVTICGGEPFVYPDMIQFIKNIPKKHMIIGIVTNFSQNLDGLANISNKDFTITASFHSYMTDREAFKEKILKLKKQGINVRVEFVAYPGTIHLLPELKTFFEKELKVKFAVDPYIDPSYKYTTKEREIVEKYLSGEFAPTIRKLGYDFDDYVLKQCDAGSKYFVVIANGDVYTCLAGFYYCTELYKDRNTINDKSYYLGNLFQGTFKPLSTWKTCRLPCSEACDRQCIKGKIIKDTDLLEADLTT